MILHIVVNQIPMMYPTALANAHVPITNKIPPINNNILITSRNIFNFGVLKSWKISNTPEMINQIPTINPSHALNVSGDVSINIPSTNIITPIITDTTLPVNIAAIIISIPITMAAIPITTANAFPADFGYARARYHR